MLGIRLTPKIREIVKKLAVSQGMNESEYVRSLIYKELEKLSIFSTNISKAKKEIFEEEEGEADVYKGD
jgi:predicted DNA-binding protein